MLKGWADGAGANLMLLNIKQFQCCGLGILSIHPDQILVTHTVQYANIGTMLSTVTHRNAQTTLPHLQAHLHICIYVTFISLFYVSYSSLLFSSNFCG